MNNNTPVRLGKKDNENNKGFEMWILEHAHIIVPVFIILLIIFVGVTITIIVSDVSATPTMVESGNYYNHFGDVI